MRSRIPCVWLGAVMSFMLASLPVALGQPVFSAIGLLPGWDRSFATGVSADGSVVVGWGVTTGGASRAFRWTASGGLHDLGEGSAFDVSDDGSVVVGVSGQGAFRWTETTGMVSLGSLIAGGSAGAYGISRDGQVIVGAATDGSGGWRAFRWTVAGGMQNLGTLPGWSEASHARGANSDGSVIVGFSDSGSLGPRAFRWNAATGMTNLGTTPIGTGSYAVRVSSNGMAAVGSGPTPFGTRAFRWAGGAGMADLECATYGNGISGDGSVVVGVLGSSAVIWTANRGLEDLNSYLPSVGANLGGLYLREATGVSSDGSAIIGADFNVAWVVTGLPVPTARCHADCNGDGQLNLADFGCFQTRFALGQFYADCNIDCALNLADFGCFQTKFALGCP